MSDTPSLTTSPLHQPTSAFAGHQVPSTIQSQSPSSAPSRLPQTPTRDSSKDMQSTPTSSSMAAAEPKKALDISNLMSPPESIPYDTFSSVSSASATMQRAVNEKRQAPANPPLSPPISPFAKPSSNISPEPTLTAPVQDPILYPSSDVASSPPNPLFSPSLSEPRSDAERLVDEHLAARPAELFERGTTPPKREEYELALYFKSSVMAHFQANPGGWLRRERGFLAADAKARASHNPARFAMLLPARRSPSHAQPIRNHANKVRKPVKPKQPKTPKQPKQPVRQARTTPVPSRNATIRVHTTPDEPRARAVAANREDKDFDSLPDFSPPISSLPNKANSLKVDWKGNPLDLSKDPNAWRLHPDEVSLAASLRLDCATYLTSKRRIFIRRLECSRIGKEFRKTDAQQACKIDVNKASKLWTAFEKVGWLGIQWMGPHADAPLPPRT